MMLEEKQRKMIPYELYLAKKYKNGNHLTNMIKRKRRDESLEINQIAPQIQNMVKRQMNEKRVEQLKKQYIQNHKISHPEPFIKRTWVSPFVTQKTGEKSNYSCLAKDMHILSSQFKKDSGISEKQIEQLNKICKTMNVNKKIHLFGDFMYCDFDKKRIGKQNYDSSNGRILKNKEKVLEQMHKQYLKLERSENSMVVCSSTIKKKKLYNPLSEDKYFNKIMKKNDDELISILIGILSSFGTFTFSSFISFYEIFIWQQATKNAQMDFVLKLLLKSAQIITEQKLNENIDFLCSKIKLPGTNQCLDGFNLVMKKLILGKQYKKSEDKNQLIISRQFLKQNLQNNEQCISIFINIFYCE